MAEKPTAAFVLSLISGIFVIMASLIIAVSGGLATAILGPLGGGLLGGIVLAVGIVGLLFGILIIVGAVMINSGVPSKVKTGSILVLILSILSLFTSVGGFFIGFILGLVGGILGLTWKPPEKQTTT